MRLLVCIAFILFLKNVADSTVTMNKRGDLFLHSLMGGDVIFSTGDGDLLVERKGRSTNLLNSLSVLDQLAGQLCFLVPPYERVNWELLNTTMNAAVGDLAYVAVGTNIYIFGGQTIFGDSASITNQIQIYNTLNNSWSLASMVIPRTQHFAAVDPSNENVYLFGGITTGGARTNTYEIYNIASKNSTVFSSPRDITQHVGGSSAVVDEKVYFFGGRFDNVINPNISVFDLSENSFYENPSNPTIKMNPPRDVTAAVSVLDKIYIMGGRNSTNVTNMVQIYDTSTNQFYNRSEFGLERENMKAVTVSGLVVLIGGRSLIPLTSELRAHYDADVLNTRTGTFSNRILNLMNFPREGFGVVTIDNHIYVFGGRSSNLITTGTVERIKPCFE